MKLKDIDPIPPKEYHRIIREFNDTAMHYPKDKCIHQLIEDQANDTPDKIAVVAYDETLTIHRFIF